MDELVSLLLGGQQHGSDACFGFIPGGRDVAVDAVGFADFVNRALRLAQGLTEMGIGPGDRVALYASPNVRYMTTMAATLLVGGVVVPINQHFRQREVSAYLTLVEPSAILTDESTDGAVAAVKPDLQRITTTAAVGERVVAIAQLESCDAAVPANVRGDDVAFIMHTSGTTGLPKGVVRTHRAYRAFVEMWAERYMARGDRVLRLFAIALRRCGIL